MIGPDTNLYAGWLLMLGGALSGAAIGLGFHKEEWLGGYGSFRRRLLRLGHIAFFGLGLLNILFALSAPRLNLGGVASTVASVGFLAGAATMPLCCFLTAWTPRARHLFPIPVLSVLVGVGAVLVG